MTEQDAKSRSVAAASRLHAMGQGRRGSKSLIQPKQQKTTPKEGRGRALMQRAVHEPQQKTSPPLLSPAGAVTQPRPQMQIRDFVQRKRGGGSLPGLPAKRILPDHSRSPLPQLNVHQSLGPESSTAAGCQGPGASPAATQRPRGSIIAGQQIHSSAIGGGGAQHSRAAGWQSSAGGSYGQAAGQLKRPLPSHWDQFTDSSSPYRRLGGPTSTFRRQAAPPARGRPLGMANLGNTCYLNATLQVLLSLQPFVADLGTAAQRSASTRDPAGVLQALQQLARAISAADSVQPAGHSLRPEALKEALERRMSAFQGSLQQDAHEFLCALLEQLQAEVVRREVADISSRSVALSATACPAARNFSFCIEHQVVCSQCKRLTRLQEQFMHLSLELPEGVDEAMRLDTQSLLQDHLQDETVEKTCEGCGAENVEHNVHHVLRRLPRVLALHFKRFRASMGPGGVPRFRKAHARIGVPDSLQLAAMTDTLTRPPLPLHHKPALQPTSSGEKENQDKGKVVPSPATVRGSSQERLPAPMATRKRHSEESGQIEEAIRRSMSDKHDPELHGADAPTPLIRAGSGGAVMADTLFCAEEAAGGSRSSSATAGIGAGDAELDSAMKASRAEAQATESVMLARATAASLAECSPGATEPAADASPKTPPMDLRAANDVQAAPDGKLPPPEWFEIEEDDYPVASRAGSGGRQQASYSLRGVISHLGSSPSSGHFTADVLDGKGRWFRHNDALVQQIWPSADISLQRSREETAYMLVYVAHGL